MRPLSNNHKKQQGIALVITLGILTVILLLAVGFALSARTEARSGSSYNDVVTAKSFAKMGMDRCLMEIIYQQQPTSPLTMSNVNYSGGYLFTHTVNKSVSITNLPLDFINRDASTNHSAVEPYWIAVTNFDGQIVGRFAYVAAGSLVDINAIGNIADTNTDTYVRGDGFIGDSSNAYVSGICADVNLASFFEKIGYADPVGLARTSMWYRYGWPITNTPPPAAGTMLPADPGDDNGVVGYEDPTEYDPVRLLGSFPNTDQAFADAPTFSGLIADPTNVVLRDYATFSSSDPNLTNSFGLPRINLNIPSNAADVPAVIDALVRAGVSNKLEQIAVNLIDFHTGNTYPTVYTPALGTNFIGVKRTPYVNQLFQTNVLIGVTNSPPAAAGQGMLIFASSFANEVWNPYATSFTNDNLTLVVSNVYFISGANITVVSVITNTFTPPIAANAYPWQASTFSVSNTVPLGSLVPGGAVTIALTNFYSFYGPTSSNLINQGSFATNFGGIFLATDTTNGFALNLEADDPRINGTNVMIGEVSSYTMAAPNTVLTNATADPHEGLASFYVKLSNYTSIGEIGYVHRGEPWTTVRLQPGGDGRILDHVRVNNLIEVRGRINLNSETNGPLGAYQSPAFWALFAGITNAPGGFELSSNKIVSIIGGLGTYRDALPDAIFANIGQICEITNVVTDNVEISFPSTNDAAREAIIRNVSNLITVRADSGATEIYAWGQTIKGKNQILGPVVLIRAKFQLVGNRIKLTKFQYITP